MEYDDGGSDVEETDRQAAEFADALAELKQRGCLLLVAGPDDEAGDAACRRLLGDAVSEPRRRLLVSAGRPDTRVGEQVAPTTPTRTISYATLARSASAAETGSELGVPHREVVGDLGDLHAAIEEAVTALEPAGRSFETSELRLCVAGADALVASEGEKAVFRFLHSLAGTLREHDAMGHVHLPAAYDGPTVQLVAPLFDAVIEVREGPQQRWHLRDADITTDWLHL